MLNENDLIELIESALEISKGTIKSGDKEWYSLWDSLGHLSILVKLDEKLEGKSSGESCALGSNFLIDFDMNS